MLLPVAAVPSRLTATERVVRWIGSSNLNRESNTRAAGIHSIDARWSCQMIIQCGLWEGDDWRDNRHVGKGGGRSFSRPDHLCYDIEKNRCVAQHQDAKPLQKPTFSDKSCSLEDLPWSTATPSKGKFILWIFCVFLPLKLYLLVFSFSCQQFFGGAKSA